MTPAEHYRQAEECLSLALEADDSETETYHLAEAQVHATLATVSFEVYSDYERAQNASAFNEVVRTDVTRDEDEG